MPLLSESVSRYVSVSDPSDSDPRIQKETRMRAGGKLPNSRLGRDTMDALIILSKFCRARTQFFFIHFLPVE